MLILQYCKYCIGIGSIGNTFSSIARVLQYILKIGIGIANTFFNNGNLFIPNTNSQYFLFDSTDAQLAAVVNPKFKLDWINSDVQRHELTDTLRAAFQCCQQLVDSINHPPLQLLL